MPIENDSIEKQRSPAQSPDGSYLSCGRFSVAFLFVVILASAIYEINYRAPRTIHWEPFSVQKRDASLASGKTVLVFLHSVASVESQFAFRQFDFRKAREICNCHDFVPLLLRHEWAGNDVNAVWKDVGANPTDPTAVVYSPGQEPVYRILLMKGQSYWN